MHLVLFEAIYGLRVNLSKSVLIPIGEVPKLKLLAHFFGCGRILSFVLPYLPSSWCEFFKSKAVCDPILENFQEINMVKIKTIVQRG